MIPVEWDDLYINFEVDKTLSGGVIFFFKYKGEYHYYMDIPSLYGIPKTEFRIEYINLFALGEDMKKIFNEHGLAEWSALQSKWMNRIKPLWILTMHHGMKVNLDQRIE